LKQSRYQRIGHDKAATEARFVAVFLEVRRSARREPPGWAARAHQAAASDAARSGTSGRPSRPAPKAPKSVAFSLHHLDREPGELVDVHLLFLNLRFRPAGLRFGERALRGAGRRKGLLLVGLGLLGLAVAPLLTFAITVLTPQ
jgi:hypothetical protein